MSEYGPEDTVTQLGELAMELSKEHSAAASVLVLEAIELIRRLQSQRDDAREILARVATSHLKDDPDADAIGARITEFLDE